MEIPEKSELRYNALIKKKQRPSQILRCKWSTLLLGEKIATAISLGLALTGVVYMLTRKTQIFSRDNGVQLPQTNDIRLVFEVASNRSLEEWKMVNQTLQVMQTSFFGKSELASNDHMHRRRRWAIEGDNNAFDDAVLVKCAEIAESIKRYTKKCVGFELLPMKCASAKPLIVCDPTSRYSAINGRCNNLRHPEWGMSGAPFLRWVPADFSDDVSAVRRSVYGVPLPNPRKLSNELFSTSTLKDSNVTMLFAFFGLYLDHDIVFTKQAIDDFNLCCTKEMKENPRKRFPGCFEIDIDASDPFYGPRNYTCMGVLRDLPVIGECPGRRENANDMTAYIDASDIYGPTYKGAADLREFKNGQLRTYKTNDSLLLPRNATGKFCFSKKKSHRCFVSGQERVKEYGLFSEVDEDYNGYDESIDATIYNAFATSVFRFGHTLIQDYAELRGQKYEIIRKRPYHDMMLNHKLLYKNRFDDIMRGMIAQKSKHVERATTEEMRNHLFDLGDVPGMDLTAISIHRGRSHGIASYLKFRKFCELPVASSWEDLYFYMKAEYVDSLKKMYLAVEDIDLIVGSIGEHHVEGALLGPTHLCLLKKQFLALRKGDRFWFQNPNQPGSFTKEQLAEIYKSSLARVICDVSNGIKMVPIFPFLTKSKENPVLLCKYISKMNLSVWKEI